MMVGLFVYACAYDGARGTVLATDVNATTSDLAITLKPQRRWAVRPPGCGAPGRQIRCAGPRISVERPMCRGGRSRRLANVTPPSHERGFDMRLLPRTALLAQGACVAALAGMAYCHIEDVGMKFDEHVYYMATLFCCNIVASLLLIPAVVVFGGRADRRARDVWAAAGALALLTIAGFLW